MKVERSISAGPRRSTEQTCMAIAEFAVGILRERSYPEVAEVSAGFERLLPLMRVLITKREFGEPAITLAMSELHVNILVGYDPAFEEDLTLPNLALLGKLSASDTITIAVNNAEDVAESLRNVLQTASTKHVRFAFSRDADLGPEEPPAPERRQDLPPADKPPEWPTASDDTVAGDEDGPVRYDDPNGDGAESDLYRDS